MGRRLRKTRQFREEIYHTYNLGKFTAEVFFWAMRVAEHLERLMKAPVTPKNRGKRFAAEFIARETAEWLENAKKHMDDLDRGGVYLRADRYENWARHYLSARPDKDFLLRDLESGQHPPRTIRPKPPTVQEMRGRGVVYKAAAEDLRELADRWLYANWRTETWKRAYDKFGRMVQPNVGKRPRTVQKILKSRPPDMGPFEGGFLDT